MRSSLRARLLGLLLASISAIWLAGVGVGYQQIKGDINTLFDANLAQMATSLMETSGHELLEELARTQRFDVVMETGAVAPDPGMERVWREMAFQVWVFGERLAMRSANAPDMPIGELRPGFSYAQFDGRRWRVYVLPNSADSLQVVVAENMAVRDTLGTDFSEKLMLVSLLLLALAALFIWISIGQGLHPLRQLARDVAARHPRNLQPISEAAVPSEVSPLVYAMNGLFQQLNFAFANERRFTADAAHELRTPLAALKTQLEVAKMASSPEVHARAVDNALKGVDRGTRLVEQLLTLARLDPDTTLPDSHLIDLCELSQEVVLEVQASAGREIEYVAGDQSLWLRGHALYLEVMLRNLLDNAVRYAGSEARVRLGFVSDAESVGFRVDDAGQGVEANEREQIFERFYRVLGNQASGSGLGLSIVKRIVELHHGHIELEQSDLGGLAVVVTFPRQSEPGLELGD